MTHLRYLDLSLVCSQLPVLGGLGLSEVCNFSPHVKLQLGRVRGAASLQETLQVGHSVPEALHKVRKKSFHPLEFVVTFYTHSTGSFLRN